MMAASSLTTFSHKSKDNSSSLTSNVLEIIRGSVARKSDCTINLQTTNKEENGDSTRQITSQDIIDALPRYNIRKNVAYSLPYTSCHLCFSHYNTGDRTISLPCRHNFHEYCIENWLKWVKPSCPIDKKSVLRSGYLGSVRNECCHVVKDIVLHKEKENACKGDSFETRKTLNTDESDSEKSMMSLSSISSFSFKSDIEKPTNPYKSVYPMVRKEAKVKNVKLDKQTFKPWVHQLQVKRNNSESSSTYSLPYTRFGNSIDSTKNCTPSVLNNAMRMKVIESQANIKACNSHQGYQKESQLPIKTLDMSNNTYTMKLALFPNSQPLKLYEKQDALPRDNFRKWSYKNDIQSFRKKSKTNFM